jgi:hypothetical protein
MRDGHRMPASLVDRPDRWAAVGKSVNHEAHEEHEDSADLAAASGGHAICGCRRPDKTILECNWSLVGRRHPQIAARRSRASQVSGCLKSLSHLSGLPSCTS